MEQNRQKQLRSSIERETKLDTEIKKERENSLNLREEIKINENKL